MITGNVSLNGNATYILEYSFTSSTWNAPAQFPGPVSSTAFDDNSLNAIYAAGANTDNQTLYFGKWDGSSYNNLLGPLQSGSVINSLQFLPLRENHVDNSIMASNRILLVSGNLQIQNQGAVSAALFDGQTWTPYLLSSNEAGVPGTIYSIFTEMDAVFSISGETYRSRLYNLLILKVDYLWVLLLESAWQLASFSS